MKKILKTIALFSLFMVINIALFNDIQLAKPPIDKVKHLIEYGPHPRYWSEVKARQAAKKLHSSLENYPDLRFLLMRELFKLPELEDMVPQGLAVAEDKYILITAYDQKKSQSSKCYILDMEGKILNIVSLNSLSHVGAIAYDDLHDLIWIPGSEGNLHTYKLSNMLSQKETQPLHTFTDTHEGLSPESNKVGNYIDYLCIEDEYLFLGSFTNNQKGQVKKYKISMEKDDVTLKEESRFKVPNLIQGLTFYKKDGRKYMMLSRSFGRKNESQLYIYDYDDTIIDFSNSETVLKKYILPPMMEQISIHGDELFVLFESKAKKYHDCPTKIDGLLTLDIKAMIE